MPGTGPAPKAPEERRTRHVPQRGEWVDLEPLDRSVLPELPRRAKGTGAWSPRTKSAWAAWRKDPVTGQYGPAEVQSALDLAFLYEEWVCGKWSLTAEIRQFQDRLGLNPKGKRDLRWRVPEKVEPEKPARPSRKASARRAHLTAVK